MYLGRDLPKIRIGHDLVIEIQLHNHTTELHFDNDKSIVASTFILVLWFLDVSTSVFVHIEQLIWALW